MLSSNSYPSNKRSNFMFFPFFKSEPSFTFFIVLTKKMCSVHNRLGFLCITEYNWLVMFSFFFPTGYCSDICVFKLFLLQKTMGFIKKNTWQVVLTHVGNQLNYKWKEFVFHGKNSWFDVFVLSYLYFKFVKNTVALL